MLKIKHTSTFLFLLFLFFSMTFLFLTYDTADNFSFAFSLRSQKLIAFLLIGVAISFSTISFQTLAQNHFLTPSILGLDALYVLLQTILFFVFQKKETLMNQPLFLFLFTLSLMILLSLFLAKAFLKVGQRDLFLLLMVGMILGTFFKSMSTFLQILMDPNEYDRLQNRLFASFTHIETNVLAIGGGLIFLFCLYLWKVSPQLDVLHLGPEKAQSLGINVTVFQTKVFMIVSILTGLTTALVGPITFLGFIVANLSYPLSQTFRHRTLFLYSSVLSFLFLIGGQFLVEHVFHLKTTLSVVVEFVGGLYFILKIIQGRKN